MRYTLQLLACSLLLGGAAQAGPTILIFDVPPSSALGADEASFVSQILRSEAQGAAKSQGAILAPAAKLPAGCDGGLCAAQAAKDKGGAFAVTGAVSARGAGTALVLRLFSAAGSALATQEATSPSGIDGLPDSLPRAIRALLASLPAAAQDTPPRSQGARPGPAAQSPSRPSAPSAATQEQAQSSQGTGKLVFWSGLSAIGAGLAFDAFAPSSHDHKLGGADFVPVGLYLVGAVALFYTMTR